MHPQLEEIIREFEGGTERLRRLSDTVPLERWAERRDPDRWSVGECIAHLNLTTMAFRPLIQEALGNARPIQGGPPRRYKRGLLGGLLWRLLGRPGRFRTRTKAAFVPGAVQPAEALIAEFEKMQEEQVGWVRAAGGLDLESARIVSPFDARAKYNLFAALSILARHQHRHLWQAEQVWAGASPKRGPADR